MKNKKNLITQIVLIVVAAGVLIEVVVWKNPNDQTSQSEASPTIATQKSEISPTIELAPIYQKPKQIQWTVSPTSWPEEDEQIKLVAWKIDDQTILTLAKSLGTFNKVTAVENTSLVTGSSSDNLYYFQFDKSAMSFGYGKNLQIASESANRTIKIGNDILIKKLEQLTKKLFSFTDNFNIQISNQSYVKNGGDGFVPASDNEATYLLFNAVYTYNSKPIYAQYSQPINAIYDRNTGELISLDVVVPPSQIETSNKIGLNDLATLKNSDEIKILAINSRNGYEGFDQNMGTVIITKASLGYYYDTSTMTLAPYLIGEGSSVVNNATVTVVIGVPAGK